MFADSAAPASGLGMGRLEELRSRGVRWLDLHFTDLTGVLRCVSVPLELAAREAERGLPLLDGSSVMGFTGIEESDLVLKPDPETIAVLPWDRGRVRAYANVYRGYGGGRLESDPRYIAERAMEYATSMGFKAFFGPEVEFMILDAVELSFSDPLTGYGYRVSSREYHAYSRGYHEPVKGAYHTPEPYDTVYAIRREIAEALEDYFGIEVEAHHHEVAAFGQVEIDFRYDTLLRTADNVQTLKYVARNIAARHGRVAVFLPKPVYGDNGNGMHTHVSLWDLRGERNLFYDENDEYAELSQLARYFIGGLLEHGRALAALVAPTTNSYRRLVPGYEAPVYLVWSRANRSAAVRVPAYEKRNPKSKRIEFRPPDPTANPYLAFAAILAAGLDGVKRKIEPGDPVDKNVYAMSPEERRRLGVKELPRSLDEALDELECDHEWLKPVVPKSVLEAYIEAKRREAELVRQYPHPIELKLYSLH